MYLSLTEISTWPSPNYIDLVKRGPDLTIVHIVIYPIIFGDVSLSTCTWLRVSQSFGLDDVFILLTILPTVFVVITLVAEFRYGWDRHAWDFLPAMVTVGSQFSLAAHVLYGAASCLTRLSMLFLCRRILSSHSRALRTIIIFAIKVIALGQPIFVIMLICQSSPISAWWTLSSTPQRRIDKNIHLLVQGILNVIADFIVVLIPIPVVHKLNLPIRQRIIVAMLFGAGFVVCFAGVVRTVYMYRATDDYYDVTWNAYPVWLSTAIELYIGIICTSVPPTTPFFARYLPKFLMKTNSQEGSRGGWTSKLATSKNTFRQSNTSGSCKAERGSISQFLCLYSSP